MSYRCPARPLKLPTSSGNVADGLPAAPSYVEITGIVGHETGGFPVTAILRSGGSAGPIVATLVCAASAVGVATPTAAEPTKCDAPLYCQIVGTGTLEASVLVL